MPYTRFEVLGIPDVPTIGPGDNVGNVIADTADVAGIVLQEHDIIVVASKAVSCAEDRVVSLDDVTPSDAAMALHQQVPRKSPALCEVIIRETGGNVVVTPEYGHILGIRPNGLRLTSGGVDKIDDHSAILLPEDSDVSARRIGETLLERLGVQIAVVVSDSEGRQGRDGAGALAVGSYGVPPLRFQEGQRGSETFVDMIAGAGAIILGQRGKGVPFAVVRGLQYGWDADSGVAKILG